MRDEDLRASCFSHLAILAAGSGDEIPYRNGLDRGFPFRGRRVPFLNLQKGIYRAAAQTGHAALSIQTSARSPYADVETPDGFLYEYRAGSIDLPDNRALRSAHELQVPIVYFVATRQGWYRANFPFYVVQDNPSTRQVLVRVNRRSETVWHCAQSTTGPSTINCSGSPRTMRYASPEIYSTRRTVRCLPC